MFKVKSSGVRAFAALLSTAAILGAPAAAKESSFKPGVDADSNGALDVAEFVMAQGEREMTIRDANEDGRLTTSEWLGQAKSGFQQLTLDRFNTDGDEFMSPAEIVEVFTWVFSNRDKNKDGKLTADETPQHLLNG